MAIILQKKADTNNDSILPNPLFILYQRQHNMYHCLDNHENKGPHIT